jgi:hypothetical protein
MKSYLLAALLCVSFCINAHSQKNWKLHEDTTYSIQYPESWELNLSDQYGTSFFLFSPLGADDQFRENVNLIIEDLTGQQIDLNAYVDLARGQLEMVIGEFNLLESKRKKLHGTDFHQVMYTGTIDGMNLKIAQHLYVKNEKAYVLTLTCIREAFDKFQAIGEKIMESFELK